jgi:hypothetical protein
MALASLMALTWAPDQAAAFSDPLAYSDPTDLGGGAGRWFTGSPADGYGCDVCHEGGAGADLGVSGLPLDGYVPGQSYEITLQWGTEHQALLAELTDEQRLGAGTVELPRPDATGLDERCSQEEGGFPASAVHEVEGGRAVVSIIDCGATRLRFRWTAPTTDVGRVWFTAGFVQSDESADPSGDGVTMVKRPLVAAGSALASREVLQGCSIATPGVARSRGGDGVQAGWGLLALSLCALRRGRGRRC